MKEWMCAIFVTGLMNMACMISIAISFNHLLDSVA